MNIFIIGPGGVGKSTAGKILAEKLGVAYIDVDREFERKFQNIQKYIKMHGYKKYCYQDSKLFYELLHTARNTVIFVLPSGFLVHEGYDTLTAKHKAALKHNGISVLLLPSKSLEESTKIVVQRELTRRPYLHADFERKKFISRYGKYKELGNIQIFSHDTPEKIAEEMRKKISAYRPIMSDETVNPRF